MHRLHPHWSLSDLKEMTPRQRKHWIKMGEARAQQRKSEMERVVREGGLPVG